MKLTIVTAVIIAATILFSFPSALAAMPSQTQKASVGTLHGQAYDALGIVIEGAHIKASSRGTVIGTAVTDKEGRYSMSGLTEGEISIEVQSPGFVSLRQTARIRAFEDVLLESCLEAGHLGDPPGWTIRGRLLDTNRNAIQGARVVVTNPFNQAVRARTATDEAGRYSLRLYGSGQHLVVAYKPGFVAESATLVLIAAERSLDFVLKPVQPR